MVRVGQALRYFGEVVRDETGAICTSWFRRLYIQAIGAMLLGFSAYGRLVPLANGGTRTLGPVALVGVRAYVTGSPA